MSGTAHAAPVRLIYRDRKSEEFRSKLSVHAFKVGMGLGVVVGLAFEIVPSLHGLIGGVIPAIIVTALGMVISNKFFTDQTWK